MIENHCVVCGKALPGETRIMACKDCLYKRPGRFIPVNGNPVEVIREQQFFETPLFPPCPHPWCGTGKTTALPAIAEELVTKAAEVNEKAFVDMLADIYQRGGSPDTIYTTLERLYARGYIGFWEFQWRRLLRQVGRWKRSVISGVRSVRRKRGTTVREMWERTRTASGTSSSAAGEPSPSSGPTPLSPSGSTTPSITRMLAGIKAISSRGESGPSPESPSSTRSLPSSPEDTARP